MGNKNSTRWGLKPIAPPDDGTVLPALIHQLMTGSLPSYRVPGWVIVMMCSAAEQQRRGEVLWAQHCDDLRRDACAHNFVPYRESGQTPRGEGVKRWQAQFRQRHGY